MKTIDKICVAGVLGAVIMITSGYIARIDTFKKIGGGLNAISVGASAVYNLTKKEKTEYNKDYDELIK